MAFRTQFSELNSEEIRFVASLLDWVQDTCRIAVLF